MQETAATPPSLYDRIGGAAAVEALIEAFYVRVLADAKLAPFFRDVPLDRLRAMQREFFSMALGGPVVYSGRPLAEVHHGRGITTSLFARFAGHLVDTLMDLGFDGGEVDEVVQRLNTFTREITGTSY